MKPILLVAVVVGVTFIAGFNHNSFEAQHSGLYLKLQAMDKHGKMDRYRVFAEKLCEPWSVLAEGWVYSSWNHGSV